MTGVVLTVIIPAYNAEKYLPQCLDSVIGQTLKDIEVICVDDGSTDGSGKILDEFAARDRRLKVIHQENAGVSAARNRGIKAARGRYLTFVDADDRIDRQALGYLCFEAERLQMDLQRAGINNKWWVVNACLSLTDTQNSFLKAKAQNELVWIKKVEQLSQGNTALIEWRNI